MGGKLFKKLRDNFEQVCQKISDTRLAGHNLRYAVADFINAPSPCFSSNTSPC